MIRMKPALEKELKIEVPKRGNLNSVLEKKYLQPFNDDVVALVVCV